MDSAKFKQDVEDSHQECHLVEQKYEPSTEGKKKKKQENELVTTWTSTECTCGSLTTVRIFVEAHC